MQGRVAGVIAVVDECRALGCVQRGEFLEEGVGLFDSGFGDCEGPGESDCGDDVGEGGEGGVEAYFELGWAGEEGCASSARGRAIVE